MLPAAAATTSVPHDGHHSVTLLPPYHATAGELPPPFINSFKILFPFIMHKSLVVISRVVLVLGFGFHAHLDY
jgi:hypothetical protein